MGEEARQDPDEARAKTAKEVRRRARAWQEQRTAMMERVDAIPAMTFWTPEERAQIEEARQDPDEALDNMKQHMRRVSQTFRAQKGAMTERVQQTPNMTRWTLEERAQIEELRQDPDEAR